MINILPHEGRLVVRKLYRLRLATVILLAGACIAIATGVFLLPSYLSTGSRERDARAEASRFAELMQKNTSAADAPLTLAQAEITVFRDMEAKVVPSVVLQALLRERGSGISITQIHYDAATARIGLSGTAATRDALLSFVQRLRKVEGVTAADLPVNDLAKNENAPFTVNIAFESEPFSAAAHSTP